MKNYGLSEILNTIKRQEPFVNKTSDEGISIYVYEYVPVIALSMHSGVNIDRKFRFNLNLTEERIVELEERLADFFIKDMPIRVVVNDSKLKYDLDKAMKNMIDYKTLKKKPNYLEIEQIKRKHEEFYIIMDALISKLLRHNSNVFIYDIHIEKNSKLDAIIKYESNKNNNQTVVEKTSMFIDVCNEFERKNKITVSRKTGIIDNSYFAKWLSGKYKKVFLFRITLKNTYFKNEFFKYDTSSINFARLLIKNIILKSHKKEFGNIKNKQSEIL